MPDCLPQGCFRNFMNRFGSSIKTSFPINRRIALARRKVFILIDSPCAAKRSEEILEDYNTVDTIMEGKNSYISLAKYWQQAENSSNDLEQAIARRISSYPDLELILGQRRKLFLVFEAISWICSRGKEIAPPERTCMLLQLY